MIRSRVVPFCLLVLLIPPLAYSAQSKSPSSAVTSVHELQIPEKARNACNKGTERFAAKDAAGSIPEFQKAIKAFPGYYEAYAKLGAAELDLEQWGAAESAFRKSMELSEGRYAPADFGLGLILATVTKKFAEAEAAV
jgi:tetratricopeptide (TPR) repeat protein